MTVQIREQVSALLDGELPRDEMGLLLRRLERDAELRRAFGSYALIGESLRAPGGPLASPSFAARVGAAIGTPEAAGAGAGARIPTASVHALRLKGPLAATAFAASVAVAAVMLLRPVGGPAPLAAVDHQYEAARPVAASASSPTPAQSQRLASYMVAHSQFSTPMVRRNVWSGLLAADPGITRVSYETGEAP